MGRDGSTGEAPRLPDQAWELTAPESYVLRQAARALPEATARFAVFGGDGLGGGDGGGDGGGGGGD